MNIVFFYSSVLALLFLAMSIRTIRLRRSLKIAVGDAGNPQMLRAMRAHSNFSEYVPFSLLLIYFASESGAHPILIHVLCCALVLGRLFHAHGISQVAEKFKFRVLGIALTLTVLAICIGYLFISSIGFI